MLHDHLLFVCQSILQTAAYRIDSRSVHVGFVVDEVGAEQVVLLVLWLSRVSIFAPNLHTLPYICHCCYVLLAIESVVK